MDLNLRHIFTVIRDQTLLLGLGIWTIATLFYFIRYSLYYSPCD